MKLDDITFWISPLSHTLNMGVVNKSKPTLANQKRDITGLMINGLVDQMLQSGNDNYSVTREGKRFSLKLEEVAVEEGVAEIVGEGNG
jgi:hypothetical protein